jgi:hypothetical protein
MQTTDSERKERLLLTGKANYLGWMKIMSPRFRRTKMMIKEKDANVYTFDTTKNVEICDEIISHVSCKIAERLPETEDALVLWHYLSEAYGVGNKYDLLDEFYELQMTGNLDPSRFIETIEVTKNKVIAAGGKVSDQEGYRVLMKGIHQIFYGDFIRNVRTIHEDFEITANMVSEIQGNLKTFYKNSPEILRNQFKVERKAYKADIKKRVWEERECEYCLVNHMNIAHTHNTTDCQARSKDELKNKRTTTYFDSGATASICSRHCICS